MRLKSTLGLALTLLSDKCFDLISMGQKISGKPTVAGGPCQYVTIGPDVRSGDVVAQELSSPKNRPPRAAARLGVCRKSFSPRNLGVLRDSAVNLFAKNPHRGDAEDAEDAQSSFSRETSCERRLVRAPNVKPSSGG